MVARLVAARRASLVFALATGIVALHIADDSFFQPQPGTSATDHLAGGLVPIGLFVLAAAAYPRLRPGLQAAAALAVGSFGVVVGATEALYYSLEVGPSGDDYTGLLTIPAGLLLLGLGAALLWRTRRLDDRRLWRYARRFLLLVAAALIASQVLFAIGLGYGTTHLLRAKVPPAHLGTAYENVTFRTSDGLRLRGWYVPSKNGAAVVAFPGRSGPQKHARMLARHGYGVLLFDRRGEGESDGDGNLFGWGGDKDILAAVEYLKTRPDVEPGRIGGIGFSVGGELMLQAAAETNDLAAVVSEGAGTRWLAEEVDEFETIPGWTKWLSLPVYTVKTGAVAVFSNTLPPPKLTDLVPRIAPRPVFLIWAPNGGNAETMNPVYYRLAGGRKEIWAIPDARHIQGITAHPKEYERRVVGFFDRALLRAG
jgi:MYXO-CTERM domain-containing protein